MTELSQFDCGYRSRYGVIAGIDEAGRGPLAGPLVAAGVILPVDFDHPVLNDSKKLTEKRRREMDQVIRGNALHIALGIVTSGEIDRNRMSWAVKASFNRVISQLSSHVDVFLIDGNSVAGLDAPARFFVKGDSRSLSIAAASVIAKVTRDDMMLDFHKRWPEYGFDRHKGYGSAAHLKTLEEQGPCPIHRMSFEPLKSAYATGQLDLFGVSGHAPGRAAENRAVIHLEKLGYTVLAKNWRCSSGEIDIIAEKAGVVTFAEVKSTTCGLSDNALERINSSKIKRIKKAAETWVAQADFQGDCEFIAVIVDTSCIETYPFS